MSSGGYTIDLGDISNFKLVKNEQDTSFSFKNNVNVSLKIVEEEKIVKEENEVIVKVRLNALQEDIAIYLFPIIKVENEFKGIDKLKKSDYFFLFLCEWNDDILIFSNNIGKYFVKYEELKTNSSKISICNGKQLGEDLEQVIEKLTASFYLFRKKDGDKEYKWKNILSFFPHFLSSALEDGNANAIYKLKGDSISFFKSRYMQEKTIKTWISERKQGENFIKSLFYGNLLKNLTVKICGKLLDLNGKGKGGFWIPTIRNDKDYFNKVKKILEKTKENQQKQNDFPIFFYDQEVIFDKAKTIDNNERSLLFSETEKALENMQGLSLKLIDVFPSVFKEDGENIFVIDDKEDGENIFVIDDGECKNKKNRTSGSLKIITCRTREFKNYKYKLLILNEVDENGVDENEVDENGVDENEVDENGVDENGVDENGVDETEVDETEVDENGVDETEVDETEVDETEVDETEVDENGVDEKKVNITDLFFLFKSESKKDENGNNGKGSGKTEENTGGSEEDGNLYLGKIKCGKQYKMELYKLYTAFKKFELDKNKSITLKKETDFGKYPKQNEESVNFGRCWFKDDRKGKECLNPDGLTYIFSGASLQDEDKLSLGLIRLLNKDGKIYICNKKASSGELADIIGYNHIENAEKLIIHLLHMKKEPFLTENPQTDGYGYYTTAIGQMLQKIEPILGGEISRFFSTDRDIPVKKGEFKEKIEEFKEKIEELKSEKKELEKKTYKQEQKEKIKELELKIEELELKIEELELKIEELELKEEKEVLEKKIKKLEQKKKKLELKIEELELKIEELELKIEELELKIEELGKKIKKTEPNYEFLSQIMESLEEDKEFLEKMDSSEKGQYKNIKKIDLRVGIALVDDQLKNPVNNFTFFMISEILLKGFEYTIKPFLEKEITVSFFPIVIENEGDKS